VRRAFGTLEQSCRETVAPEAVDVGQEVRLTNLVSHKDCEAAIVRQGNTVQQVGT
jgi:hypothetical protein